MAPPPIVSIIVPAYNVAPFVGSTLESIAAQSFQDYETIVVNDGSTDETARIVRNFDRRLVYIEQENRGLSAARNRALAAARGKYVALLDADDIWFPGYLSKMVRMLEGDPSIDVAYPNAVLFGTPESEGKLFQDLHPSRRPVTFEKILTRECMIFVSATFKRDVLERVGLFDESLRSAEDLDLWLRMARAGCRFEFTSEPLVRYRKRSGSLTQQSTRLIDSVIRVYGKVLEDSRTTERERRLVAPLLETLEAQRNQALARSLVAQKDYRKAAHHLRLANAHYRSPKLFLVASVLRFAPWLARGWGRDC